MIKWNRKMKLERFDIKRKKLYIKRKRVGIIFLKFKLRKSENENKTCDQK
jgi:hypothetical protein